MAINVTTKTTNKVLFEFMDTNEKKVYISITKCKGYTAELELACDNIAETILNNQQCLEYNPPLWYLNKIAHIDQEVHTAEDKS